MTIVDTAVASPAPDNVRSDLVAGVLRHNRRRARQRKAGVGILGALGVLGALSLDSADPAFAVMRAPSGVVEIEVYPELDEVDDLQVALAEAGLEASIVNLRAHPSLVGVVEVSGHSNEAIGAMTFADGTFEIDASAVDGPVEVLIYSAAGEGDYQASPSLFSPDQELAGLHCGYTETPLTTAEFESRAGEVGLSNLHWTTFGDTDPDTLAVEAEESSDRPDGFVEGAHLLNSETVAVFVSEANDQPAAESIVMHDGTHNEAVPGCTADLAARWE